MNKHWHTLIIGSGFGGLCMAAKLKEQGDDDFLILEKANAIGGTWRENTYPGAECDVPSALYSYSFARNPTWDFKWAKQPQILQYINRFADERDLSRHVKFQSEVVSASFDGTVWTLCLSDSKTLECRFLVSAIGQLHHPNIPDFKGREDYGGISFHSAQWDHNVSLKGKNVAVIGNAASAVQLIPEVAETAGKLTIYHRTPNWVIPKGDRPYSKLEKALGRCFPWLTNIYRFHIWCLGEYGLWPMIKGNPVAAWAGRIMSKRHLRKSIKDKNLRDVLTPDYPIGAKRVLLSDKYFLALARDNVDVVDGGVGAFSKTGVGDKEGINRAHDVVVFATGFHTNPFLKAIEVRGSNGTTLTKKWAGGAYAYYGTMVSDFPNLFILYGPNTNTGHTSIIFKLEQQVGYILKLMAKAEQGTITVKPQAEAKFNDEMQSRLSKLAWAKIDASWYKDGDRVTNNWPGSSLEFKRRLKEPIWDNFEVSNAKS
jgi:cation diffusion facilitator CzcD-associated flavoprotein CzcO